MLEQLPETVPVIFMFTGGDARGFDLRVQSAETRIVMRRQALFHPVDTIRRDHFRHFNRIPLRPGHPAIEHDVAIGPQFSARALHQVDIFPHAFAPIRRSVSDCEFQTLEAERDVLIDVVAGAVRRNAMFRFAAD